jgi:LacI family gluconate utilization system Gnt-I transcriptional repressor
VIGFGNLSASAYTHPALTTVAVDGARIGREAARLLLERLEGKAAHPRARPIIDVGSHVFARETT